MYLLALIKLITPFFLQNSFYQPHRDEFLYLAEAHHMAWGYMEVPPLLSVFAWLTNAFGGSMFWIKIWPALFSAFTFIMIGKIILSLGGKTFALILGWLPFMLDGYMRLFFLFQANFLEVFFWTAIAYTIILYIQTGKNKWLYYFGVSIGLGMMSKYSVAFYTVSILAGLLITRHRKIFLNKHFYLAAVIAIAIFLPNLIWQYYHRFPVITHMQELQDEQLLFINTSDFIISQFMMNLPCIFIWIAGLFFVVLSDKGKPLRLFAWAYTCVIVLLIVLHGKDYYALGAYPVLFAFGAYHLEKATSLHFKFTRYVMMIFSITLGLFALPLIMPVAKPDALAKYYQVTKLNKTGSFKWEDLQMHPLPQDFADMIGWKELTEKTAAVYNSMPEEQKKKTIIFCNQYAHAGALTYYGPQFGLPEVYSANASFVLWLPDKPDVKNIILVAHDLPDSSNIIFHQFEKMSVKDSLNYPLARENGVKIILFENGNDKLDGMIEATVAKLKSQFTR